MAKIRGTLIEVGNDHRLVAPEPLAAMLRACEGTDMTADDAQNKLKSLASPEAAALAIRFFKTGPGQYGDGDTFIGINVPTLRTVFRAFRAY